MSSSSINIQSQPKKNTNLFLSKNYRFVWIVLLVKPHRINWISFSHSIVKRDNLNNKKYYVQQGRNQGGEGEQLYFRQGKGAGKVRSLTKKITGSKKATLTFSGLSVYKRGQYTTQLVF